MFKDKFTFQERLGESKRILEKFPKRIPIVIEIEKTKLDRYKYLVPCDITMGKFLHIVKTKILKDIKPEEAIFVLINNMIPNNTELMSVIYKNNKEADGFIYCTISKEKVFG